MSVAERMEDFRGADLDIDVEEAANPEGHWKVTAADQADWCLRKLAPLITERQRIVDYIDEEMAALVAFRERELARLDPQITHWETTLAVWHRSLLAEDDSRKTIHLPHGDLKARKLPDGINIPDPAGLLERLKVEAPAFVRTKTVHELDRAAIKTAVAKGGELIAGVEFAPGEVRFEIDTVQS